jgi:hypothetical protein
MSTLTARMVVVVCFLFCFFAEAYAGCGQFVQWLVALQALVKIFSGPLLYEAIALLWWLQDRPAHACSVGTSQLFLLPFGYVGKVHRRDARCRPSYIMCVYCLCMLFCAVYITQFSWSVLILVLILLFSYKKKTN